MPEDARELVWVIKGPVIRDDKKKTGIYRLNIVLNSDIGKVPYFIAFYA